MSIGTTVVVVKTYQVDKDGGGHWLSREERYKSLRLTIHRKREMNRYRLSRKRHANGSRRSKRMKDKKPIILPIWESWVWNLAS